MRNKQVAEILKQDFEDYYNMDDRIGDLKSHVNFSSMGISRRNTITMRKSKFITACILSSLLLVGGSSLITYYATTNVRDHFKFIYLQSIDSASNFLSSEVDDFVSLPIQSYSFENRAIFNLYLCQKDNMDCYFFQIYNKSISDFFLVEFIFHDESIKIQSDSQQQNPIQLLNFKINSGDKILGSIYANSELYRNIAIIA